MTQRLAGLQRDFLGHLRNQPGGLPQAITPGGRIDVSRRLHIYHHAYRARLTEVLQDVFERTWAYLGDEAFAAVAMAFIDDHPPAATTLQDFGQALPAWLAKRFPDDAEIAEVAMLDAMLRTAFEAANATPLTLADFATLTAEQWARIGLAFHPSVQQVPLTHNAASIWEALDQALVPPPAARLDSETWLLVWRKDWRPHFITVGEIEALALQQLLAGRSFAATCVDLDARFQGGGAVQRIGVALRQWIDDQLIVGLRDRDAV